ncbi:hypothetical protein D3C80_2004120 [compost metagenome]
MENMKKVEKSFGIELADKRDMFVLSGPFEFLGKHKMSVYDVSSQSFVYDLS